MHVAVLGASGKTGRYLVPHLLEAGHTVTAIGRSAERLAALDARAARAVADLERPQTARNALDQSAAEAVVSLAHARFTETLLGALPASATRLVLTGSTRAFTALPDAAAAAVRAGEAAFLASGRAGLMLHPSLIYGAPDDRNVNRLLALFRRWPRAIAMPVPLPDGGRHMVQPVFVDDVIAAIVAALTVEPSGAETLVLAGPEPMTYADFVRQCAAAVGRRAAIVSLPLRPMVGAVRGLERLGLPIPVTADEIARAGEDKRFDVAPLRRRLGVAPRPFETGLRDKLARGWVPWSAAAG